MDYLELGVKKHNEGKLEEAELIYRKILSQSPDNDNALHLLGLIAYQTAHYNEAVILIKKAINLKPSSIYYHNLAMIYQALKNDEQAIANFELAIEDNYENAHIAHYNLGLYAKDKKEFKKALKYFEKAIELKENFYDAIWNKSLISLILGDFKQGFKDYEARFKKEKPADERIFNKPKWNLEENQKVLVVCEQGFGDNIQFSRYLSFIKERNCKVILECKSELVNLFKNSADEIVIRDKNKLPEADYDYYVHIMSLPKVFQTTLENIPHQAYLKADKSLVENYKKIITGKFKVGICWAGNSNQENDKNRSATFNSFKLLSIPEITLYSLQKDAQEQIDTITNLSNYMTDFSETAAIIENLDLVISVDTSISHLAGALGKPVWTLLSEIPDWRYFLERADSPWYPTMKLFRKQNGESWNSLLVQVADELKKIVETTS